MGEAAITQMTTEEATAKQDVQMAKALTEEKRQNKDSADEQLSQAEGASHSKAEAASAASADQATAQGELDKADAEKTELKQKADTAACPGRCEAPRNVEYARPLQMSHACTGKVPGCRC